MAATSVHYPIYPQYPSNKRAITILRNNGANMTTIEDVPKPERRRPITEKPKRGDRRLHRETFSFESNPNLTGDNSTSYGSEFSGLSAKFVPAKAARFPSQLGSHFEIGVGSNVRSDTTTNLAFSDKLKTTIQANDQYAALSNMAYQRYGANMKTALGSNRDFPACRTSVYREEVLAKGPFPSFTTYGSKDYQPRFSIPEAPRNILTWGETKFGHSDCDFRRFSGNRVLTRNLDRSKSIL